MQSSVLAILFTAVLLAGPDPSASEPSSVPGSLELSVVDAATGEAVLAYLNLPPAGALADRDGPPVLESNDVSVLDSLNLSSW